MSNILLEMKGITKYIYDTSGKPIRGTDVKILNNVQFDLNGGEVHVLLGENGAGKSTLMKILGGVIPCDSGEIRINGEKVSFSNPRQARAMGVAFIHQELNLCTNLDVAHNIYLGRESTRKFGTMNEKEIHEHSQRIIQSMGFDIPSDVRLGTLSTAQQQVVEIAKALSYQCKILIMDEPTSSLTSQEITQLFELIRQVKSQGVGIIYISHRMDEIEKLADRITVLRDGEYVGTIHRSAFSVERVVEMMVGRTLHQYYVCNHAPTDRVVLEVKNLKIGRNTLPVDLKVHAGEIVGIGGLVGAGRTELAKSIFGARKFYGGEVYIEGERVTHLTPIKSIRSGLAYLSEDRKTEGLTIDMTIRENISVTSLLEKFKGLFLPRKRERQLAQEIIEKFDVVCNSMEQRVNTLSGGNQQRVSFGKWFAIDPKILILDEPTRGIDVNAKAQIYSIMDAAARDGMAILMITSELEELIGMSDRIYIMRDGTLSGEIVHRKDMTQQRILEMTMGIQKQNGGEGEHARKS